MKKIILFLYILLFFSVGNSFVLADGEANSPGGSEASSNNQTNTTGGPTKITVKVTEKIPGGDCSLIESGTGAGLYECKIEPGFKSVQGIIGNIIKWITAIAALAGVLFIVINGIMLSTGSETGEVKKRIVNGIIGLILVLLSGVILNMIAPWVYK